MSVEWHESRAMVARQLIEITPKLVEKVPNLRILVVGWRLMCMRSFCKKANLSMKCWAEIALP